MCRDARTHGHANEQGGNIMPPATLRWIHVDLHLTIHAYVITFLHDKGQQVFAEHSKVHFQ